MSNSVIAVGFDFGTKRSKAAYVDATERPIAIQNKRGDFYTPSVIAFDDQGKPYLIGEEALLEAFVRPDHVLADFKPELGSNKVLYKGDKEYTATQLAALVLKSMKEDVERATNTTVNSAVLSCPANTKDDFRAALMEAARMAGIEPEALIGEPSAAGLGYAYNKQYDRRFVIFDLGGGTLDVSVIEVSGNNITVTGTEGVPQLGGRDFTARLEKRILEAFARQTGEHPSKQDDPHFFQELYQKAEGVKITLSEREDRTVVIGCRGKQAIVKVTRSEFVSMCSDLFDQCIECADKAIKGRGHTWKDIDSLVMVGGSSRMPYIQEQLANISGLAPKNDILPDRAVAIGTVLKARLVLGEKGVLPHPGIFVREVSSHDLGCCVLKPGGKGEDDLVQVALISKNTPVPAQKTDSFFLQHEDQTAVKIIIAQGDDGSPLRQCLEIGEIQLENLPKESKRTQRIKVDYALDTNGMAKVTATDLVGGASETVSIDCKKDVKRKK